MSAAAERLTGGKGPGEAQTFGELSIEDHIIRTPRSTISIRNIARVEIWWESKSRTRSEPHSPDTFTYGKAGLPLLIGFLIILTTPLVIQETITVLLVSALCAWLLWLYINQPTTKSEPFKMHWLSISTSDGIRTSFASEDSNFVELAWYVLTDRMNAKEQVAPITINFEQGTIENLNVASAGSVHHATNVSGTGHTVASNGATAVSGQHHAVQTANGANGRVATSEATYTATRSPGAQLGNGHGQNGAAHSNAERAIDFSRHLPDIVEMHRFYARQPNTEHLEQRLHELELLMRAGAPSPHQKSRIRELSGDLSNILQAYPPIAQIFQQIGGLTL